MSASTVIKSHSELQDVVLSFFPPDKRTTQAKERLLACRLPLILILQAALTWRLNDIVSNDEALYTHAGQVAIAHLLHGGAQNAALLHFYGGFFSGAPNVYPVVAAALDSTGGLLLARLFSLFLMLLATMCVHRIGRHLFGENVALLAALAFVATGSVQYIGKYATFDAPCLALLAFAAAVGITKRSMPSAAVVGALLALASVTKYAGLALVPFVLLLTFVTSLTTGGRWQGNFIKAALRGSIATLTFAGLLIIGYWLWGSGIAAGVKFTTTSRKALDPGPTWYLLESLVFDIGLSYLLAICAIVLMVARRTWDKASVMLIMLVGGTIIQASSVRIHEFTSLDKHTAFSGLFVAVPAAVTLDWLLSKRGRAMLMAFAIVWLLLIDGMWRSAYQYSWPSSIMSPINQIEKLNIPGQYFSFDSETGAYYTQGNPGIVWYPSADAYSIFVQGLSEVTAAEKSHEFTGFLFEPTDLSAQDRGELRVFERLLASDPYYFETGTFQVSPYTKAKWELWIHYPVGYHGPSLKVSPNDLC
jgi:hypothetical protein